MVDRHLVDIVCVIRRLGGRVPVYLFVVLLLAAPSAWAQTTDPAEHGFIVLPPEEMRPPEGSRSVRMVGDARESGRYVTRITFAAGTGTRPHFHDQARYITVIKGTWWVALGPEAATYAPEKMVPVTTGSFLFQPAHGIHYDQARAEEVIVQIAGMGPVKTTRLETEP